MSNLLGKYYRGITQQLRSEVDFINSLFQHQGVKGEANEALLRELLTKFIPKRYGVGTGIVIDRHGNPSRQCDIVVYDNFLYPSLLSLATAHLFPVDIVYAVIEVKTTLSATEAERALENIASVRQLDIIKEKFVTWECRGDKEALVAHIPKPPVGCVFAYDSTAKNFETFKNWFTPQDDTQTPNYPNLVGCLDQGIVEFKDISLEEGMKPEGLALPIAIDDVGHFLALTKSAKSFSHEGVVYPVKQVKGDYVPIDQSRVLLLFILTLNDVLTVKRINPTIRFIDYYLESAMFTHVSV